MTSLRLMSLSRRPLLAGASLVLLVACTQAGSSSEPSASPTASESPTPSVTASAEASPATESATPSPDDPDGEAGEPLTGTLGYEGIEGGCSFVESGGTRYQVIYPDGYSIDAATGDLLGPDGEVLVPIGGDLELHGAVNDDLGSICQIGPIFEAVEVAAR